MKINYTNKKALERLLNQGVGYSLFTVSTEKGFEKIAIKKGLFKKKYTITFFDETTNAIETKEVKIELLDNLTLFIDGFGTCEIQEANFVLKNPTKQVERENEIFRQIDRKARTEEQAKSEEIQRQIIESKDAEIEQIKSEANEQVENHTSGRIDRLRDICESAIKTSVYHESSSYKQVYSLCQGYHMESSSDDYNYKENHTLVFLIKRLKSISKTFGCDVFENGRLLELTGRVKEKLDSVKDNSEEEANIIMSLYGLIADELTARVYSLCDHIRENDINTNNISYNKILHSGSSQFFEESSSWSETEYIEDYFKTVIEAAATFVEKVTGQDIRSEIELRLTKQQIMIIPQFVKTIR